MTYSKPILAWAIKAPDGSYVVDPGMSESQARKQAVVKTSLMQEAYRCVRVQITEV